MRLLSKIKALYYEERAAVAVITTIFLTAMLGLTGAAVDMGRIYSSYNELQNAADAAAKAGADSMLAWDPDGNAATQTETASAIAKTYSLNNEAMGTKLVLLDDDITMGFWDFDIDDFDPSRTGSTGAPEDLTAFRVTVRRDGEANSPVSTSFAGILGLPEISLSTTSTAYLGYAGSTSGGQVDLPIAVHSDALGGGGGEPNCGDSIRFSSERNENGEWTTFFSWPTNSNTVKDYVDGSRESPELEIGDRLNVVNGRLSTHVFYALNYRFQTEGSDTDGDGYADEWLVLLPVVKPGHCSCNPTLTGFVYMTITEVRGPPYKDVQGTLSCNMVVPDSQTGGENFGARATFSKTVQ